eukprot:4479093-Pyramimonas_sp.AAC.1
MESTTDLLRHIWDSISLKPREPIVQDFFCGPIDIRATPRSFAWLSKNRFNGIPTVMMRGPMRPGLGSADSAPLESSSQDSQLC